MINYSAIKMLKSLYDKPIFASPSARRVKCGDNDYYLKLFNLLYRLGSFTKPIRALKYSKRNRIDRWTDAVLLKTLKNALDFSTQVISPQDV